MMQRLKLPQYLRWCVIHITLTLAIAPAAIALHLPRQHGCPCGYPQISQRCAMPQKDKAEEAKIIEQQLDLLIHSKKGMLVFRSQADLARAFDLMANYPSTMMVSTPNSPQSRKPPVVAYLEQENKGFQSLFSAPLGLPAGWHSYPLLAALLNKDQAVIVRDDIYAFNGPEHLYRLPESQRRSYKVIRNRRFSAKLPNGSAFYQIGTEPQNRIVKTHDNEGVKPPPKTPAPHQPFEVYSDAPKNKKSETRRKRGQVAPSEENREPLDTEKKKGSIVFKTLQRVAIVAFVVLIFISGFFLGNIFRVF